MEALCALALAGVLVAAAGTALDHTRRTTARVESRVRALRAAQEGVSVAAALLRDAAEVTIEADTAVAFAQAIASGVICATEFRAVWLPPAAASDIRLHRRAHPIEPGDVLMALRLDSLGRALGVWRAVVDSVVERVASPGCGPAEGWVAAADAAAPRTRLVFADSVPSDVTAGVPVRAHRRMRMALYRDGQREWMLGLRRCAAAGTPCGTVQPLAGPLAPPASGGFRVTAAPRGMVMETRPVKGAAVVRQQVEVHGAP